MGHNLIINDVKELSDEQQQSIKEKREKNLRNLNLN